MSASPSEKKSGSTAANSSAGGNDLQENLRRLDRLANLGLVSASIAHEIKNGLVAIKTYVEILVEKGDDTEMAEVVRRELTRIDGLATQMLRLSAPKSTTLAKVQIHQVLDQQTEGRAPIADVILSNHAVPAELEHAAQRVADDR